MRQKATEMNSLLWEKSTAKLTEVKLVLFQGGGGQPVQCVHVEPSTGDDRTQQLGHPHPPEPFRLSARYCSPENTRTEDAHFIQNPAPTRK